MSDPQQLALQVQRNTHIGRYLLELNRSFVAATLTHLQENGFESVTPHHIHIIAQVDIEGTPVSKVLVRSGVTKQSLSNTLGVLESNGFIRRTVSTSDGRVRCVEFTTKGKSLLRAGLVAVEEVEQQYASILGNKRFLELKRALGDLHSATAAE